MSDSIQNYIRSKLQQRKDESNFRSLKITKGLVDFYSNDYLGFARDRSLQQQVEKEMEKLPELMLGSTGSRLLSGNSVYAESLEKQLSEFHSAASALLFNSGFDANYGLLSSLPYRGDTVIYDELVHASIHDGIRKSKASAKVFPHNNLDELKKLLERANGLKYVVVESVYSMDGDFAPLTEITDLCQQFDAGLIIDEAHATGVFGKKGEGRVSELGLENKCLARIHTFGKALGAHGAVILGSHDLKEFLINYARSFIFSTALPLHSLANIRCAYQYLPQVNERREKIFQLVELFKKVMKENSILPLIESQSPIQSLLIPGNAEAKRVAEKAQKAGLDVRAILYPTVSKRKERLRVCIHSFNSDEEVMNLCRSINN